MFARLLILFTIIPVAELYVLIEIGSRIGTLNTILVIILTATAGAYLARTEGFSVLNKIRQSMSSGQAPGQALLHGLFVLVGGLTLLTPGFITDAIGLSMLIPPLRQIYVNWGSRWVKNKIDRGDWQINIPGA